MDKLKYKYVIEIHRSKEDGFVSKVDISYLHISYNN